MRQVLYATAAALVLTPAATSLNAQTAGETKLGVTVIELNDIVNGWSARRQLLGRPVYNDKNEEVGKIEDLIIARERTVPYVIVSSGGFLGIGAHDVAIPTAQLRKTGDRLILPGATKELVRAMPPFVYAPK